MFRIKHIKNITYNNSTVPKSFHLINLTTIVATVFQSLETNWWVRWMIQEVQKDLLTKQCQTIWNWKPIPEKETSLWPLQLCILLEISNSLLCCWCYYFESHIQKYKALSACYWTGFTQARFKQWTAKAWLFENFAPLMYLIRNYSEHDLKFIETEINKLNFTLVCSYFTCIQ